MTANCAEMAPAGGFANTTSARFCWTSEKPPVVIAHKIAEQGRGGDERALAMGRGFGVGRLRLAAATLDCRRAPTRLGDDPRRRAVGPCRAVAGARQRPADLRWCGSVRSRRRFCLRRPHRARYLARAGAVFGAQRAAANLYPSASVSALCRHRGGGWRGRGGGVGRAWLAHRRAGGRDAASAGGSSGLLSRRRAVVAHRSRALAGPGRADPAPAEAKWRAIRRRGPARAGGNPPRLRNYRPRRARGAARAASAEAGGGDIRPGAACHPGAMRIVLRCPPCSARPAFRFPRRLRRRLRRRHIWQPRGSGLGSQFELERNLPC